jgi:hypothetical protein
MTPPEEGTLLGYVDPIVSCDPEPGIMLLVYWKSGIHAIHIDNPAFFSTQDNDNRLPKCHPQHISEEEMRFFLETHPQFYDLYFESKVSDVDTRKLILRNPQMLRDADIKWLFVNRPQEMHRYLSGRESEECLLGLLPR